MDDDTMSSENAEMVEKSAWQIAFEKIEWEQVINSVVKYFTQRTVGTLTKYLLAGFIIWIAYNLALNGILEGQAIAGFLGAAIGYLLSSKPE